MLPEALNFGSGLLQRDCAAPLTQTTPYHLWRCGGAVSRPRGGRAARMGDFYLGGRRFRRAPEPPAPRRHAARRQQAQESVGVCARALRAQVDVAAMSGAAM